MARKVRIDDLYPNVVPCEVRSCPLCDRVMDDADADSHHLIPRQKGGAKGPQVPIHRFCHTKIHSILKNNELAKSYNTIEALRAHPEIARFIEWVADKPSNFYMKNSETRDRRKRH
jgi:hypothetical protein